MSDFMFINSEVQLLKSELTNRLILWVLHADKIPPHIGLSKNDQFYSLKVSGKDEGLPVRNVLQIIEKKNIGSLAFEINQSINLSDIKQVFDNYTKAKFNEVTCLDPIKKILNVDDAETIHSLLKSLYHQEAISSCTLLHLSSDYKGIPLYKISDIHSRINKLEHV
jgi:hypothetical protein